jgi:nicotinamidase-related amidase
MSPADTALLVVDVQAKLIGAIVDHARVVWNIRRLLDAAKILGVPTAATEQYPAALGPTVPELAERLASPAAKLTFSCGECGSIFDGWRERGVFKVLVVGIETHVCVAQTALDLLAAGFRVYVAADAVGAPGALDHDVALHRLDSAGATLTTTEAAMFEWCQAAGTPVFKEILKLVKEQLA